ncbi:MAG TPA: hypothetical protein VNY78_02935 [Edaphobacter sp.]|jgi:hypothetical protein|nr:hypothetical protein [Edaphobacter sp.]
MSGQSREARSAFLKGTPSTVEVSFGDFPLSTFVVKEGKYKLLARMLKYLKSHKRSIALLSLVISVQAQQPIHGRPVVKIPEVKSGNAVIHQRGLTTTLVLTKPSGKPQKVILTHKSSDPRFLTIPYEAKILAEIPNKLLIFTDTFISNPDNVQGHCGANQTGETFLHVVSLTPDMHETLSVLIDSCLLGISNMEDPVFDPSKRTLSFDLSGDVDLPYTFTYHIGPDNSVTLVQPVGWHGFPP